MLRMCAGWRFLPLEKRSLSRKKVRRERKNKGKVCFYDSLERMIDPIPLFVRIPLPTDSKNSGISEISTDL